MDWSKFIAETLPAGVGGFIGGTLGAYLKSYWTEKGKNLATYEDIKTLLAEERGKAYEQEKGKRLATHEDIENVLNEVQVMTEKAETIKAQISGNLWTWQRIWEQKLHAYSTLLREVHEFINSTSDVAKETPYKPVELANAISNYKAVFGRLGAALAEVEIVTNNKARELIGEFRKNISGDHLTLEGQKLFYSFIGPWIYEVTQVAKQDLGIPNE